jgi:anti-anti-sigma factor
MAESQFIKTETVRNGVLAKILIEKVSDYESTVLCNELNQVGEGARWRMVLDMSRVQLLTSAGIRVLITMHTAAAKNKGKFIIAGMSDELMELIKMTRLDKMFSMVKDSKKGVEAIA